MTKRQANPESASERARKVSTPWRGKTIYKPKKSSNAMRQAQARKQMDECELLTGKSAAELDEFHRLQRERVLARYGVRVELKEAA